MLNILIKMDWLVFIYEIVLTYNENIVTIEKWMVLKLDCIYFAQNIMSILSLR